jgi:hypothetical protein
MDQWLQQNATTFSPAGYRSQLQPNINLPLLPQAGDGSSMVRSLLYHPRALKWHQAVCCAIQVMNTCNQKDH